MVDQLKVALHESSYIIHLFFGVLLPFSVCLYASFLLMVLPTCQLFFSTIQYGINNTFTLTAAAVRH
jgi:hypothetical protein